MWVAYAIWLALFKQNASLLIRIVLCFGVLSRLPRE